MANMRKPCEQCNATGIAMDGTGADCPVCHGDGSVPINVTVLPERPPKNVSTFTGAAKPVGMPEPVQAEPTVKQVDPAGYAEPDDSTNSFGLSGWLLKAGVHQSGQGLVQLLLYVAPDQPPTHAITVTDEVAMAMGKALSQTGVQVAMGAANYRKANARRLAHQERQAHGGIILPSGIEVPNA